MSRLTQIVRLRHPGVLHDFAWSEELQAFGAYNLFYGWNGTGKTTIGRVLRALELRRAPLAGDVTLKIDGRDISGPEFSDSTLHVRVFNRDYVAESIFATGGANVPPIFVVGKESVEQQKKIDTLKESLAAAQSALDTSKAKSQEAARSLDRYCIERARSVKDLLRSGGNNRYNNYDKSDLVTDIQKSSAHDARSTSPKLDELAREKLLSQIRATLKPKLQIIGYTFPDHWQVSNAAIDLLGKTVTSSTLEELKREPAVAEWVEQGLKLHHEQKSDLCMFCTQSLPGGRLRTLEAHFNDQFAKQAAEIELQIDTLRRLADELARVALPKTAELYEDLAEDYASRERAFRNTASQYQERVFQPLINLLHQKRKHPFEPIPFAYAPPTVEPEIVERLNSVIRTHNATSDDFDRHVRTARDRLAGDIVADSLETYGVLSIAMLGESQAMESQQAEIRRITDEIASLQREIVKHRRPAEELNRDLQAYLGHDELHLEVKDAGYALMRSGVPASSLSEGENTAIALLYFLKSLSDERFDRKNGVVVLDDPVSSLDANSLYLAFGYIRDRTQDVHQVFVLTHNFGFFRQIKNWFQHLNKRKKKDQRPARFYMLECERRGGRRSSSIRPLDPLLEQYESEYHYLFARIYRTAFREGAAPLDENYMFPNAGRRLLEAFLAFRYPAQAGELWQKLKQVSFDEAKKLRILRFVQTHSHGDSIGESGHDPAILGETNGVMRDLLELIESLDKAHFDAMAQLVNPTAADDGDA